MSNLVWLSNAQMRRIEPFFPLSDGVPRVDDRRIVSGIIFVIRNGLRWCRTPLHVRHLHRRNRHLLAQSMHRP